MKCERRGCDGYVSTILTTEDPFPKSAVETTNWAVCPLHAEVATREFKKVGMNIIQGRSVGAVAVSELKNEVQG